MINRLRSEWRRCNNDHSYGNEEVLDGYHIVDILCEDNTRKGQIWGEYHPDNLSQYWADKNVSWYGDVCMLSVRKEPKDFGNDIIIPYGVGFVESLNSYKYGYFEAQCSLPKAKGQWPAFWLTGDNAWPPEIDIVEGYSKGDKYGNNRRFQTNVHYKDSEGKHKMVKGKNHPMPKEDHYYTSFHAAVLWEKDVIKFYYNGYVVRTITDRKVLDALNCPMKVLVNSAVQTSGKYAVQPAITIFKDIIIWQRDE